jgi:hypothetical protein
MTESFPARLQLLLALFHAGSVAAMAAVVGIPEGTLYDQISGRRANPRGSLLAQLARAYPNVDADWLLTGRGVSPMPETDPLNPAATQGFLAWRALLDQLGLPGKGEPDGPYTLWLMLPGWPLASADQQLIPIQWARTGPLALNHAAVQATNTAQDLIYQGWMAYVANLWATLKPEALRAQMSTIIRPLPAVTLSAPAPLGPDAQRPSSAPIPKPTGKRTRGRPRTAGTPTKPTSKRKRS